MEKENQDKSTLPNYRWIKVDIGTLKDPDLMSLSEIAFSTYVKLNLIAGESDAEGLLCNDHKPYSLKDLAWILRRSESEFKNTISELSECNVLSVADEGYFLPRFLSEQGPGDDAKRDEWRKRQKKHRESVNTKLNKSKVDVEESRRVTDMSQLSHGDNTEIPKEDTPATAINENLQSLNKQTDDDETEKISEFDRGNQEIDEIEEKQATLIYTNVTGNIALPIDGTKSKAIIETITKIWFVKGDETITYLQPFFQEWRKRKYSKSNPGWLDWAIAGEIPPKRDTKGKVVSESNQMTYEEAEALGKEMGLWKKEYDPVYVNGEVKLQERKPDTTEEEETVEPSKPTQERKSFADYRKQTGARIPGVVQSIQEGISN